ncbi:MAG: LuxR C-terminal-related transcriptional regulator [Gaiellales bacterium]
MTIVMEPQRERQSKLGVFIIDPLATVRAGLSMLVEEQPDMEVAAMTGDSDETISALRQVDRRTGLIALLSLGLGGEHDSFWLIRTLRERFPTLAVIACGSNSDKTSISRALFVGADGFVDKNADPAEFIDAVRRCAQGDVVLVGPPSDWLGPISEEIDRQKDTDSLLTDREIEVLTLAAEGLTARLIGEKLGLRERTVTTHLGRIYAKLGVGTRIAAISMATSSGIISAPRSAV